MLVSKTDSFGNIFLHIDREAARAASLFPPVPADIAALCAVQQGLAADGVIFYSERPDYCEFSIYNADGSEAELSGNGMAGLATVLAKDKESELFRFRTRGGFKTVKVEKVSPKECLCEVEIGTPDYNDRGTFPFLEGSFGCHTFLDHKFYPVTVGNPHIVFLTEMEPSAKTMAGLHEKAQADGTLFPRRVNLEFVLERENSFKAWYYERGVGQTASSSTGSAAILAVLARLRDISRAELETVRGDRITVFADGGRIFVRNRTKLLLTTAINIPKK